MLKAIGWTILVPGAVVFVASVYLWIQEPNSVSAAIALGVFVGAFLPPALLFALADIVQNTRETRDAVLALKTQRTTYATPRADDRPKSQSVAPGSSIFGRVKELEQGAAEEGEEERVRSNTFASPGSGLVR